MKSSCDEPLIFAIGRHILRGINILGGPFPLNKAKFYAVRIASSKTSSYAQRCSVVCIGMSCVDKSSRRCESRSIREQRKGHSDAFGTPLRVMFNVIQAYSSNKLGSRIQNLSATCSSGGEEIVASRTFSHPRDSWRSSPKSRCEQ